MNKLILICLFIWSTSEASFLKEQKGLNELKDTIDRPFNFIDAESVGNFQLKRHGKKFLSVSSSDGFPLAIFDLSLSPLSWKEIALGSFKIKDFNIRGALRNIKCSRKLRRELNKYEMKDKKMKTKCLKGKAEESLAFEWSDLQLKGQKRFKHQSFSLGEMALSNNEMRKVISEPFKELYLMMNPLESSIGEDDLVDFLDEFEMRFSKEKKSYQLVWNLLKRKKKKKTKLPGVLVNYLNPIAPYAHRARLLRIDQLADYFKFRWFPYGPLAAAFIYRVVDKLIDRVNYHESQLISLLEYEQQGKYDSGIPWELIPPTLGLLYLPRSRPTSFASGRNYQKRVWNRWSKNSQLIKKKLRRRMKKKKWGMQTIAGGKFHIVRNFNGRGQLMKIISSSNKPTRFAKVVSTHVSNKNPYWKAVERFSNNLTGYLVKAFLRTFVRVNIWRQFGINLSIPRDTWEKLVRHRHLRELELEGYLVGMLDEARAGRMNLPLNEGEVVMARSYISKVYLNPFEPNLDKEDGIIEANLKTLKKALAEMSVVQFRNSPLVPFTY